jgi:hypothetical protein
MNKLILIGNGFDLAHGLKTKYSDFILWFLNKEFRLALNLTSKYSSGKLLKINIHSRPEYKEFNSIKTFQDEIEFQCDHAFLKNIIDQTSKYNWADIEYNYYLFLVNIYRKFEASSSDQYDAIALEIEKLNDCFDLIKQELINYLLTIDSHNCKNGEIETLFEELIGKEPKGSIHQTLFLNFNYTSTLELYTKNFKSASYKINYIHGNLIDNNNPIIFGYGDEMDTFYEKLERSNTNDFLKNIKSFGYFKTKNYGDFSRFIDSAEFDVYIMGHSCGISDRILLNSIFEHSNCHKIKIFYYAKNNIENDYFEKTQEISRHFKANNKGKMRKIIFSFQECQPLTQFKS